MDINGLLKCVEWFVGWVECGGTSDKLDIELAKNLSEVLRRYYREVGD